MKITAAILATILTGIGGHFINRRFDRALFFFLAFILWPIAIVIYQFWAAQEQSSFLGVRFPDFYTVLFGAAIIWGLSILLTAYDALSVKTKKQTSWSFTGIVGALASTLLSALILVYGVWLAVFEFGIRADSEASVVESEIGFRAGSKFFYEYIYFGEANAREALPLPPKGDAYLAGRFMYKGAPAVGVRLKLMLNNKYESESLQTDDKGVFHLRVPSGEWRVNVIRTDYWEHRPSGVDNFVVVTGDEPLLKPGSQYSGFHPFKGAEGRLLVATDTINSDSLSLNIRDELRIHWPQQIGEDIVQVSIDDAMISWGEVEGAAKYLVQISEVEVSGNSTRSMTISSKLVEEGSSLALNTFRTVSSKSADKHYSVSVYAFDESNRYLTESEGSHRSGLFELNEDVAIIDDLPTPAFGSFEKYTDKELEEIFLNRERIKAIKVLVNEGLLDQAQVLIGRVEGRYEDGRLEAVKGYLHAKRGECDKAKQLFDAALQAGGEICVPKSYREPCAQ